MRARLLGSLRPVRRYSQAAKGHARCLDYFSLVANGGKGYQVCVHEKTAHASAIGPELTCRFDQDTNAAQSLFIRELREFVKAKQEQQDWAAGSQGAQSTSLVLLASRDLASWLEDREFMSDFLGSLQLSQNDVKGKATVDVLSGVTDGLAHQRWYKHKPPASGISVLLGNENILPRLWEQEDTESSRDPDRAASVSFSAAAAGNPHNSNITIPLANTIFQNGRRSTLFATRYETDSTGHAAATLMREKTHQDIEITTSEGPNFSTLVTLIPLTPPRKIVAGLGNIVRQVEVNGKATPASKEIEALIPQLLGKRQSQSPVGVWAVVVPPHLVEDGIFAKLFSYSEIPEDQNISELQLFERNGKMLSMFHHYGFRIHKVCRSKYSASLAGTLTTIYMLTVSSEWRRRMGRKAGATLPRSRH